MKLPEHESDTTLTAEWDIDCDGYYPFCTNCRFEPAAEVHKNNWLPRYCPNCGARIINLDHFN